LSYFENCIDQLQVNGKATKVYHNEMEDGEEIQGLDLIISSKKK
jgi:hypothetical protein